MQVYLERQKKRLTLHAKDGKDLLKQLKLPEAEVILVRNNEVILPDDELRETDDIQILSVISGG